MEFILNETNNVYKVLGIPDSFAQNINECKLCGENHITSSCVLLLNYKQIYDSKILSKARLSVPRELKIIDMSDCTTKLIANTNINKGVRFGPFEGTRIQNLLPNIDFPLKIFKQSSEECDFYIDTTNENTSNWMCLVSVATNAIEQNLICYQIKSDIYYSVIKDINFGDTLKVWYAPYYALKMGATGFKETLEKKEIEPEIDIKANQKIAESLPAKSLGVPKPASCWQCKFCKEVITNVVIYTQHLEKHYKDLAMNTNKCTICLKGFLSNKILEHHKKTVHNSISSNTFNQLNKLIMTPKLNSESNNNTKPETTKSECDQKTKNKDNNNTNELYNAVTNDYSSKSHRLPLVNDILLGGQTSDQLENNSLLIQNSTIDNVNLNSLNCSQEMVHSPLLDNVNILSRISDMNLDLAKETEDLNTDSLQDILYDNSKTDRINDFNLDFEVSRTSNDDLNSNSASMSESLSENTNNSMQSISSKPPFLCDICSKSFQSIEYLLRHLKKHSGEYTCNTCYKVFCRRESYETHLCNQPKVIYSCDYCKKTFTQKKYLNRHIRRHQLKYSCSKCNNKFESDTQLNEHVCRDIENDKSLECEICHRRYKDSKYVREHIRLCHNKEKSKSKPNKTEVCYVCGEIFDSYKVLKMHIASIHNEKKFKCDYCDKSFRRLDVCRIHLTKHQDAKVKCEQCGKLMKSIKSLKSHIAAMHSDSRRMFPCTNCNKNFTQKINLEKHMKLAHTTQQKQIFPCDQCPKSFALERQLKSHQLDVHSPNKNLSCEFCEKKFARNYLLKRHCLNNHAGRMFSCPYCSTVVKHRASIRRHLDKNHSQLRSEWNSISFIAKLGTSDALTSKQSSSESSRKTDLIKKDVNLNMLNIDDDQMQIESTLSSQLVFNDQIGFQNIVFPKPGIDDIRNSDLLLDNSLNVEDIRMDSDNTNDFQMNKIFNSECSQMTEDTSKESSKESNFESLLQNTDNLLDIQSLIENDGTLINLPNDIVDGIESLPMDMGSSVHSDMNNLEMDGTSKTNEVMLSVAGVQSTNNLLPYENDREITLGKNAFILDDGTIVEPQDEGNVMFYVLNSEFTNKIDLPLSKLL